jgi:DNA helicase II / ATP-dependent DNA helicase PcrA
MKRDAARNLRERVRTRCGNELAACFDSYTFDSFSKSLVDRFLAALPEPFRPTVDYAVLNGSELNERKSLDLVKSISSRTLGLSDRQIYSINTTPLWRAFIGRALPLDGKWTNRSEAEVAAASLWNHLLRSGTHSALGFPMLGRMAELLLRANPFLQRALRSTYRFVFLDEFQDTSTIHYHLLQTAFQGTDAVLTAVGDNKQTIMRWAGAMPDIFNHFENDFGAIRTPLTRNYRSSKQLVDVQTIVARAVDDTATPAVSMVSDDEGQGEFRMLAFEDDEHEAEYLAALINKWVQDGQEPHDICVLCRMKPATYAALLQAELSKVNIASRVEVELQDLLSEPLAETLLNFLKLVVKAPAPEAWSRTVCLLGDLRGDDSEAAMRRVTDSLLNFLAELEETLESTETDAASLLTVLMSIMAFVGKASFQGLHAQYQREEWYEKVMTDLAEAVSHERSKYDWPKCIDSLEGVNSVPIMSTHKSKGLEYHTVVFVGLEDGAHWNFAKAEIEETCGFFVAMSRAERRVVFTFAGSRPTGKRGEYVTQGRRELKPLYDLLKAAGVAVETIERGETP